MKKLMALCLAMVMALSMVSFSVMAEETEVVVTFEDIANGQPQDFVVDNLDASVYAITSSSNEAVIALNGKVTRPLFEDAKVTLTINEGAPVEVTVKSQKIETISYEDFTVTNNEVSIGDFNGVSSWRFSEGTLNTSTASNGKMVIGQITSSNSKYSTLTTGITTAANKTSVWMADISGISSNSSPLGGVDVRLSYRRYDKDGNVLDAVGDQNIYTIHRNKSFEVEPYGYSTGAFKDFKSGKIGFKIDNSTGDFYVLDGKDFVKTKTNLFNLATTYKSDGSVNVDYSAHNDKVAYVRVTGLIFKSCAGTYGVTYTLDNVVQYNELSDMEILSTKATAQQKADYYSKYLEKNYVANGGSLDMLANNLKFTADETLVDGVSIAWESNNAAISADGTVKRSITETQTATITGTLTVDGAALVVKTYNVNIAPLTIVGASEILDFEGIPAGTAIETTDNWTSAASTLSATTAKEANGNTYLKLVSENKTAYSGDARKYTFTNVPSVTGAKYIVMKARVHVPSMSGSAANLTLTLNKTKAGEFMLGSAGYPGYIYGGGLLTKNPWHTAATKSGTRARTKIPTSNFIDIEIKIDPSAGKVYYYQCGELVDTATYGIPDDPNTSPANEETYNPNLTTLNSATFHVAWREAIGEVWLDDVCLYTETTPEAVLSSLSDSDKVAYYKGIVEKTNLGNATAVGAALDLDQTYVDMTPATYGVTINWASDNTEYVSNDGTVKKLAPHGETVTVNMTAAITAGDASATVAIPVIVGSETTLLSEVDFSNPSVLTGDHAEITDDAVLHMKNEKVGEHKSSNYSKDTNGDGVLEGFGLSGIFGGDRGDRFIFSYDVKYENGIRESYGGVVLKTYAGSNGIGVYLNYGTNKVSVVTTEVVANDSGTGVEVVDSQTKYYQIPAAVLKKGEGKWVNIKVDHNALSQTYNVYVDGILINDIPILQACMNLGSNGSAAVRGYSVELSNSGEIWVDNVALYSYSDSTAEEVNAALNAALIDYASTFVHPVLTNCELPDMTIGRSWIKGTAYDRDLTEAGKIKPTNVSTYKYVTDGPAITWTVDGKPATAINVASPQTVEITVTATKNGISESKTFQRKVAPAAIRDIAVNGSSSVNGIWLSRVKNGNKVIIARYNNGDFVNATTVKITDANYNSKTEILGLSSVLPPSGDATCDQIKIFVVDADGITPLTFANTELRD